LKNRNQLLASEVLGGNGAFEHGEKASGTFTPVKVSGLGRSNRANLDLGRSAPIKNQKQAIIEFNQVKR